MKKPFDKLITFNGQGCSGKTTQSSLLAKLDKKKYQRKHTYALRSCFEKEFYNNELKRKDIFIKYLNNGDHTQKLSHVEVLGFPSLAWLTAHFHWKIEPLLKNYIIVLDHYIGDFYADMLEGIDPEKFQDFVKDHLGIPHFKQGVHFYLDIDYATYEYRWKKREEKDHRENRIKVKRKIFEVRRERYKRLCELEYLKCIDAKGHESEVTEALKRF